MPEVVNEYITSGNFATVEEIQDEILTDYADDFSKHAPVSEIEKIRLIWESIPKQLAKENNKFVYEEDGEIFPVEVKSAANTQAKSYRQFCKKYKAKAGYKLSLKNIAHNDCEGVFTISLPLYLQWNMDQMRGK